MVSSILCFVVLAFTFVFYVRLALSFFPARPGPMMQVRELTFSATEPALMPLRRAIPPLPGAAAGIGVAELAMFLILFVLQAVICR